MPTTSPVANFHEDVNPVYDLVVIGSGFAVSFDEYVYRDEVTHDDFCGSA